MIRAAIGLSAWLCAICATSGAGISAPQQTAGADPCPPGLVAGLPGRATGASTGAGVSGLGPGDSIDGRDEAAAAALMDGNLPGFLRHLSPVVLGGGGHGPEITLCVTPDYLAIGSDADFLRMPLGLPTAIRIASRLGFVLPTRRIVDAIYAQADVHLTPQPLPPTAKMVSTAYFRRHNRAIEAQRHDLGAPLGALTAGHKKDLVLTRRLWSKPGRVAIYGWHRPDGRAIQPLSTVHGARYADYSHGVRLVSTVVTVGGERRSIYDVLADPVLAPILSDEGPMPRLGELVAALGGAPAGAAMARRLAAAADAVAGVRVAGR